MKRHAFNSAPADPEWLARYNAEYELQRSYGLPHDRAKEVAYNEVRFVSPYAQDNPHAHDTDRKRLIADAWKHRPLGLPDPTQAAMKADARDAQAAYSRAYAERAAFDKQREALEPRQREADAQFIEDCIEMTGDAVAPEQAKKQRREKITLEAQTFEIAERLRDDAGLDLFRPDNCRFWRYFIHTQHWEPLMQYRRCVFLPSVAAQTRAPMLAALEYFIQRNRYCRFWTFTSGERCPTTRLRARIASLHSRLNELNKELRARYGVEIILRSTELGTPEFDAGDNAVADSGAGRIEFDAEGNPLWHVHAHCVVRSMVGYIQPDKWREMYKWIGTFWGWHWNGGDKKNGVIKNARECVKYVTKPGDILALSGRQMRELYEATSRMKLVQPMGALREEIRARKTGPVPKTLRRYRTKNGEILWRERTDHNKQGITHPDEREAFNALADAIDMERETRLAAKTEPGTPLTVLENAPFCRVTARLAPAMGPENFKEPSVLVMGTHRDVRAVMRHPLVESLWQETVMSWETRHEATAERAAPINVHTDTSTGGTENRNFDFWADTTSPPPPRGTNFFQLPPTDP